MGNRSAGAIKEIRAIPAHCRQRGLDQIAPIRPRPEIVLKA